MPFLVNLASPLLIFPGISILQQWAVHCANGPLADAPSYGTSACQEKCYHLIKATIGVYPGLVAPPAFFFLVLAAMVLAYLLAVEVIKQWFFRRFASW